MDSTPNNDEHTHVETCRGERFPLDHPLVIDAIEKHGHHRRYAPNRFVDDSFRWMRIVTALRSAGIDVDAWCDRYESKSNNGHTAPTSPTDDSSANGEPLTPEPQSPALASLHWVSDAATVAALEALGLQAVEWPPLRDHNSSPAFAKLPEHLTVAGRQHVVTGGWSDRAKRPKAAEHLIAALHAAGADSISYATADDHDHDHFDVRFIGMRIRHEGPEHVLQLLRDAPRVEPSRTQGTARLFDQHRKVLEASGLTQETIALSCIYSETSREKLAELLGWKSWPKKMGGAWVIPYFSPGSAEPFAYRVRPDTPRSTKGRTAKYESRKDAGFAPYFPPRSRESGAYRDVTKPLTKVEGEKKASLLDQLGYTTLGLPGIQCSHDRPHKDATGEWRLHPMILQHVELRGRDVTICFDASDNPKPDEPRAAAQIARMYLNAGARSVKYITPPKDGGAKGIDDYFVAHGEQATRALLASATDIEPAPDTDNSDPLPAGVDKLSELAQVHRLVRDRGESLRYDKTHNWMVYDGDVWRVDDESAAYRSCVALSQQTVLAAKAELFEAQSRCAASPSDATRAALEQAKRFVGYAAKCQTERSLSSVLRLARHVAPIATSPDIWDANDWVLGCANGVIDLRTGVLRPHAREDYITKVSPVVYDPSASAPLWEKFLERVLPNADARGFLQRFTGYALTGDTSEQCLAVLWGPDGDNGKSTFVETLRYVLGAYAQSTATNTLMAATAGHRGVENDVACLRGSRLVTATESDKERALDTERIKKLTGEDEVKARFLFKEFFGFLPKFKLVLAANHRPKIRDSDNAIWRRVHTITFDVKIPEREKDRQLKAKLRAEGPGILRWALAGCLEWQRLGGLCAPSAVTAATASWRGETQLVAQFVDECAVRELGQEVAASALHESLLVWCELRGKDPVSKTMLGLELSRIGFVGRHRHSGGVWQGLRLKREFEL